VEGLVRESGRGAKTVRGVDGIDLRVEPDEIYGFLGPSGAGKSTTVLTRLLPPTAGAARVAGYGLVKEGPQGTLRHRRGFCRGRRWARVFSKNTLMSKLCRI
jgi:ABC-type multidrug transport system ATPase subunit